MLQHQKTQSGFTLVELAIVLMIIGLLIGGILRGQELIKNAQVTSTIQQVKAYTGAKHTFMDEYAAWPGDMPTATARIPNCTGTCINGNGDGVIGAAGTDTWANVTSAINSENTQFWNHLALAHLISGVTTNSNTIAFGQSLPLAKINGGFFIRYALTTIPLANVTIPAGHYFILRKGSSGNWDCGNAGGNLEQSCTISPQRASQIDRKMDDGIAYGGDVLSVSSNSASGCGVNNVGENGPNGYNEGKDQPACDMMFRLQ